MWANVWTVVLVWAAAGLGWAGERWPCVALRHSFCNWNAWNRWASPFPLKPMHGRSFDSTTLAEQALCLDGPRWFWCLLNPSAGTMTFVYSRPFEFLLASNWKVNLHSRVCGLRCTYHSPFQYLQLIWDKFKFCDCICFNLLHTLCIFQIDPLTTQ